MDVNVERKKLGRGRVRGVVIGEKEWGGGRGVLGEGVILSF